MIRMLAAGMLTVSVVYLVPRNPSAPAEFEESAPATFVVVYDPGPRWEVDKAASEQPGIADHGRYLIQLYSDGVMKSAGPFQDGGGLVVLQAESEAAARDIVAADPGVRAGLLQVNMLRRWDQRDWDAYIRR